MPPDLRVTKEGVTQQVCFIGVRETRETFIPWALVRSSICNFLPLFEQGAQDGGLGV